jgi:hypothetical protein
MFQVGCTCQFDEAPTKYVNECRVCCTGSLVSGAVFSMFTIEHLFLPVSGTLKHANSDSRSLH